MQKILSAAQTRAADQHTIQEEPIASIDLMERASVAFVSEFGKYFTRERSVHVLCGPGNNGGDGFAIARLLTEQGYHVKCSLVRIGNGLSSDCQQNFERFEALQTVTEIKSREDLKLEEDLLIDAVFGSGLNRPATGLVAELIEMVNAAALTVIAVDIPSGLFADKVEAEATVIEADLTISFQLPKLSFLIPESGRYTGEWIATDIGLSPEFLANQSSQYSLIDQEYVQSVLPQRPKFGHKGTFGRVQLVSGSLGKMGAATLCGEAILKSGAGLLTIHVPAVGLSVVQTVLREAMATIDDCSDHISEVPTMEHADVICVGPGIGTHKDTVDALTKLLHAATRPMVIDADALNIIAQTPGLLKHVPQGSVLTPHVGEFERLFGKQANGLERIKKMQEIAVTNKLVLVLKGAHTVVVDETGEACFNTTGNAGMATAGSGDVLAGIITGLMAPGLSGRDAAIAGVFLHGLAGDLAKNKVGKLSLMASNLLNELHQAFNNVGLTSLF